MVKRILIIVTEEDHKELSKHKDRLGMSWEEVLMDWLKRVTEEQ